MTDCVVCSLPHQADIHAATLSIHRYLRARLKLAIAPVKAGIRGRRVLTPIGTVGRIPKFEARFEAPLSRQQWD